MGTETYRIKSFKEKGENLEMELGAYSEGRYPDLSVVTPLQYLKEGALKLLQERKVVILGNEIGKRAVAALSGLKTNIYVEKDKNKYAEMFPEEKDFMITMGKDRKIEAI